MYAGTIFEVVDKSEIEKITISNTLNRPLFMAAFTADKGPEKYVRVAGEDFFKLFGNDISFAKHGQPLLEAAEAINSGAELLCRRAVDPNSKLANMAVIATVESVEVQKKDEKGALLYTDTQGKETTESSNLEGENTPVMLSTCKIKYSTKSVEDVASIDDVYNNILTNSKDPNEYPLFVIADNGRCKSAKRFLIKPDYISSKSSDYMKYFFTVLEKNSEIENIQFAFDPDTTEGSMSVDLQSMIKTNSKQIVCRQFESKMNAFIKRICVVSGVDPDEFQECDMIFGMTKKGQAIPNITIDLTGVNLSHPYGIELVGGSNGDFADAPLDASNYDEEMAKVFNGDYGDEIYDVDKYKIDAIVDANYPAAVKRAIEDLVNFRKDAEYFRDLGLGLNSLQLIKFADTASTKSPFCASYGVSYDVIDRYSKKQISVTIGYTLVRLLVQHFANGRTRPLAGLLNKFTIPEAIEGTVNFIPVITPETNQKEELDDLRINYISEIDGVYCIESLYTSQEKFTQLSYINNVLAMQEVAKAVRTKCPKIRYASIESGQDLEAYQAEVQSVLDRFAGNFVELSLIYTEDKTYAANKIYYATIKFRFKNFAQTEYFRLMALPS